MLVAAVEACIGGGVVSLAWRVVGLMFRVRLDCDRGLRSVVVLEVRAWCR